MKKRLFLLLACFLFVPVCTTHAVLVTISSSDGDEAIAFGTANRSAIEQKLDSRYPFGSTDEYSEGGVIHTKWYKLALMAAQKARQGGTLSTQEQSEIISDPCLQINIKVYGRSLDFAKDYQVTLLQGNKVIKSEKMHADSFTSDASAKNSMAGFPGYWAIVRSYFRYASFDPTKPAILSLKKDGKESRFPIDLTRYK